jgi:tRNA(Ile)-lysidine synthase
VRAAFARHLDRSAILAGRRRLLVAVSGGLDSVVLLHLLRFGGAGRELRAAHFDHRMRPGSDGDAHWVRGLCRAWQVPCITDAAVSVPRSEAAARDQRYAFLHSAAAATGADTILTAHHADDQAETILFRLARGTGLGGLRGIPARRGSIVRPLLPFARRELEAYALQVGLDWRTDPTNLEHRYARNRIRHVVLPALDAVSPGAAGRIAALAERAEEAEAAWGAIVADAVAGVLTARSDSGFELARDALLGYHPHVRARVLRLLLRRLGAAPDRAGTRAVMEFISSGGSGSGVEAGAGVRVEREFDRIVLRRVAPAEAPADAALAGAVHIPAARTGSALLELDGVRRSVRWLPAPAAGSDAGESAGFDASSLRFPLVLRGWRPGDRIRLPYGSKKLKKLFGEMRLSREERSRTPVLAEGRDRVLWVVGRLRAVDAPPADPREILQITVCDG